MLCGHPYIHAVSDILRMYYDSVEIVETTDSGGATATVVKAGDDGWTVCSMLDGNQVTTSWERNGEDLGTCGPVAGNSAKREVKRQIYQAVSSITGLTFPWGSLTGIRPTQVAAECKSDPSSLRDHYFVSESKSALAFEACFHEERLQERLTPDLFHAYIGIPFCGAAVFIARLCPRSSSVRESGFRDISMRS